MFKPIAPLTLLLRQKPLSPSPLVRFALCWCSPFHLHHFGALVSPLSAATGPVNPNVSVTPTVRPQRGEWLCQDFVLAHHLLHSSMQPPMEGGGAVSTSGTQAGDA